MSAKLDIAIIGGSIAGCIAARLLVDAGHHVSVYERSEHGLIGRGGGLATSKKILDAFRAAGLIDADFPFVAFSHLHMAKADGSEMGRCPLKVPIDLQCVHWGGLWQNLRQNIADAAYKRGHRFTALQRVETGGYRIEFADAGTAEADLVLFADGYNSMGRGLLSPESRFVPRDYFVWRGTLDASEIGDTAPLDVHPRYSFRDIKGSFITYAIPHHEGDAHGRLINWAAYLPLEAVSLDWLMRDIKGNRRTGSVPAGAVPAETDRVLLNLIDGQLPPYYLDIVRRSTANQIQLIYMCRAQRMAHERMALIGDAASVAPPLTGSGVFKAYENARDLVEQLSLHDDLDAALDIWAQRQGVIAEKMLRWALQLEQAFVWDTLDLAKATPEAAARWWESAHDIPSEYHYFTSTMPLRDAGHALEIS